MTTTIYLLEKNNIPFYVGKTIGPWRKKIHIKKYGEDICYLELDNIPTNEWKFWEKHYISLFNSWGFNLKNKNKGGGGLTYHSEETKLKMSTPRPHTGKNISKSKKGMVSVTLGKTWKCKNIITQETKDKIYTIDRNNKISKKLSKSVLQYDLEGNFIKEWSSVTEARKQTNISKIDKVARGEGKISGGFRWKYKN
jgi:hypothetical protein